MSLWSHQGSLPDRISLQTPQQVLLLPHATHCEDHPSTGAVQGRTGCKEEEEEGKAVCKCEARREDDLGDCELFG